MGEAVPEANLAFKRDIAQSVREVQGWANKRRIRPETLMYAFQSLARAHQLPSKLSTTFSDLWSRVIDRRKCSLRCGRFRPEMADRFGLALCARSARRE